MTKRHRWGDIDGELVWLSQCKCGAEFKPWDFILTIYEDDPRQCPECGRMLYFSVKVTIHEVER